MAKGNTDPAPAPTPPRKVGAEWLGRPVVKPEHAAELEREAALNEFGHKMPRQEAEAKAYEAYQRRLRVEASAYHLAGMKAAHAAGDTEAARRHALMYELHSKALGHDHVGPADPQVVALMERQPPKVYRFRPHHGDVFAVADHGKARDFDEKPLNAEGEDPSGKANAEAKHHPLGKALGALYAACEVLAKAHDPALGRRVKCKNRMSAAADTVLGPDHYKRGETKPKVVPCRCEAYHHPHRAGGGRCGAK